jgi:hypothetical protein
MQNKRHSLSFLGIENSEKENPEKCRNNFLLLNQFVFSSPIEFNPRFRELTKAFKKTPKYLRFFQTNLELKNFYLSTFRNIR